MLLTQTNEINYKSKWFYFSFFLIVSWLDRDFPSTVHSHNSFGGEKVEGKKEDGKYPMADS